MILITAQGKDNYTTFYLYYPTAMAGDRNFFDFKHLVTQETFAFDIDVNSVTERATEYIYDFEGLPEGMYIVGVNETVSGPLLQRHLAYVCNGTPLTESTFVEYNPAQSPNHVYVDD